MKHITNKRGKISNPVVTGDTTVSFQKNVLRDIRDCQKVWVWDCDNCGRIKKNGIASNVITGDCQWGALGFGLIEEDVGWVARRPSGARALSISFMSLKRAPTICSSIGCTICGAEGSLVLSRPAPTHCPQAVNRPLGGGRRSRTNPLGVGGSLGEGGTERTQEERWTAISGWRSWSRDRDDGGGCWNKCGLRWM